jgi:hypothetical protein
VDSGSVEEMLRLPLLCLVCLLVATCCGRPDPLSRHLSSAVAASGLSQGEGVDVRLPLHCSYVFQCRYPTFRRNFVRNLSNALKLKLNLLLSVVVDVCVCGLSEPMATETLAARRTILTPDLEHQPGIHR